MSIDSYRRLTIVSMALVAALTLELSARARDVARGAPVAPIELTDASVPFVFEGFVLGPEGAPAEGVVVVSSAGGKTVTDWSGSFRLEVQVSPEARSVQVTAVGSGRSLVASASVAFSAASRIARVDPLLLAPGAECQASWLPTFGGRPETGPVLALAVFDDGSGSALFAGGHFETAGGVAADHIAKWDGSSWAALGSGRDDIVYALAPFDDGSALELFTGGNIAKWDGSSWSAVGSGLDGWVGALTAFDDGGGPALFAGGLFTSAGGVPLNFIGKWDGSNWSALGSGMNNRVNALAVFDDGGGPALFAGGLFTTAGGVTANRIARWDGSSWTALGSGMSGSVRALTVLDAGGGPALYAGGQFGSAGGVAANRIARWNGSSWSALGSGMNDWVNALAVFDDGSGPALHAGGYFATAGGAAASRVAKWDGSNWMALGSGLSDPGVEALTVFDDGNGPALYAGGFFATAGGMTVSHIAKWDGSSWSALGSGLDQTGVEALTAFDDGSGPALYAGGSFMTAGGVAASCLAKWDGSSWSALGSGMSQGVQALTELDDGSGPALYAGGLFQSAFDSGDSYIARWGTLPDTTSPTLSCPPAVAVRDRPGSPPGEVVTFSVTASDNCDPSPSVVCAPPSGSFFPFGETLVTCTATDASGNQSTCQFSVYVQLLNLRLGRPR